MRNRQYQELNWKTLSDPLMVFDAHMLSAAHQAGRFPRNDACVCVCVWVCEWVRTRFPGVRTNQNEEKNGSRQKIIKKASRNVGTERPSKKLRQKKTSLKRSFSLVSYYDVTTRPENEWKHSPAPAYTVSSMVGPSNCIHWIRIYEKVNSHHSLSEEYQDGANIYCNQCLG